MKNAAARIEARIELPTCGDLSSAQEETGSALDPKSRRFRIAVLAGKWVVPGRQETLSQDNVSDKMRTLFGKYRLVRFHERVERI